MAWSHHSVKTCGSARQGTQGRSCAPPRPVFHVHASSQLIVPVQKEVIAFAPATVANLGPGFDWMGCAVEVRLLKSGALLPTHLLHNLPPTHVQPPCYPLPGYTHDASATGPLPLYCLVVGGQRLTHSSCRAGRG